MPLNPSNPQVSRENASRPTESGFITMEPTKTELDCEEAYLLSVLIDPIKGITKEVDLLGFGIAQKDEQYTVDYHIINVYDNKFSDRLLRRYLVTEDELDAIRFGHCLSFDDDEHISYTLKGVHALTTTREDESWLDVDVTVHVLRAYDPYTLIN